MFRLLRWMPLALLIAVTPALAELEAGLGLGLAWPQGEFEDHVDFAIGGAGRVGWGFPQGAAAGFSVFADATYLNYGNDSRTEPFSTTIPDVTVRVETENFMVMVSPGISFGRRRGVVRPYLEAFGGITYIATTTSIKNLAVGSEDIASSTNFDDFTYNLGGGGGLQFQVWQRDESKPRQAAIELGSALIDLKLSWLKGGEAEYLKEGSISRGPGARISFDTIRSETDMVVARIGATLLF